MKNTKNNKLKISLLVTAGIVVGAGAIKVVGATTSYIQDQRAEQIKQQQIAEAERLEAERIRKEKEDYEKNMIGVSYQGRANSYDAVKVAEKLKKYDYSNNGEKIVFLTFDDGASKTVTPQILDVLKDNDVNATFFVTGKTIVNGGDEAKALIKRSFDEGNSIANHSYEHDYKYLYPGRTLNLENFKADFNKTEELLKEIIDPNFSTRVLRCPGGYMSWKGMSALDEHLTKNNMASIDWNALIADAEGKKKNAQELVEYGIKTSEGKEMVVLLMHDTYGKEETAKALPDIIKYYKDNGYAFKTLA